MKEKQNISEGYFGDELTRYGFMSHMEAYMKQLLTNPKKAEVDDYLKSHGIDNEKALKLLLKKTDPNNEESAVLVKKTKIKTGEDGKDIFTISYKIPREGYKKKMRKLYINCFESNIVEGCPIIENNNPYVPQFFTNEEQMVKEIETMDKDNAYKTRGGLNKPINETDCAGCMQEGGDNPDAGQFVVPYGKKKGSGIITRTFAEGKKRTVYMTEDQVKHLKKIIGEATANPSEITPASELAYPAFNDKKFAGETTDHHNICADKNLMKGGVTGVKV